MHLDFIDTVSLCISHKVRISAANLSEDTCLWEERMRLCLEYLYLFTEKCYISEGRLSEGKPTHRKTQNKPTCDLRPWVPV